MVTGFHRSGHGATYEQIGSCTVSFFCSCSLSTSVAVNCLVIEPSRNFVVGVLGICHSALAHPVALGDHRRAVAGDQHDAAEAVHADLCLQVGVDFLRDLGRRCRY